VSVELKTSRGNYVLALEKDPEHLADATMLTLSLARRDGIEKIAFRCRIATALGTPREPDALLASLAPWMEQEFEMVRESALKAIRSERKLYQIAFDELHQGPFRAT
jgi:hypothetical protein